MVRASWSWILCDPAGYALAELTTAQGCTLAAKRNTYTEGQFSISHEDDAADLLLKTLRDSGTPQLRCIRKGPNDLAGIQRFRGYMAPLQEEAEEASVLTCTFRSPFSRLLGDSSARGYFTPPSVVYSAQDAGSGIAFPLLAAANAQGASGLVPGTVQATKVRDRSYQDANVGESITALTNVLDGFDFEEVYLDAAGVNLAQLNIYASQGQDRPNARFEYGPATLANVRNMKRTTEAPINSVVVIGGNGLRGADSNAASIAKYGLCPYQETLSSVIEQATLNARATALLRPNPVKVVDFTPDYAMESCPQPWDDFWLGDTGRFYAKRAALVEAFSPRINAITVAIDDNGYEVAEIPDPTSPDEEATIRSNLSVEVL